MPEIVVGIEQESPDGEFNTGDIAAVLDFCGKFQFKGSDLGICTWRYNDEYSLWQTECDGAIRYGSIDEDRVKFCPFCGRNVVIEE